MVKNTYGCRIEESYESEIIIRPPVAFFSLLIVLLRQLAITIALTSVKEDEQAAKDRIYI